MRTPVLGVLVGAVLGALDGASAWASPDARPMIYTRARLKRLSG